MAVKNTNLCERGESLTAGFGVCIILLGLEWLLVGVRLERIKIVFSYW